MATPDTGTLRHNDTKRATPLLKDPLKKGYQKLFAWQKSDELVHAIYDATKAFPREEFYGITNQIRRAALSVPTNLAEGQGRQNKGEMKQFTNIALGSLSEVEYLLYFSAKRGFLTAAQYENLSKQCSYAGALTWKLLQSLSEK